MPHSQLPPTGRGNLGSHLAVGSSGGVAGALGDAMGGSRHLPQVWLWDRAEIGVSQRN